MSLSNAPHPSNPGQPQQTNAITAIGAALSIYKENATTFLNLSGLFILAVFTLYGTMYLTGTSSSDVMDSVGNESTIMPAWIDFLLIANPYSPVFSILISLAKFVISCTIIKAAHVALTTGKVAFAQSFENINWLPALAVFLVAETVTNVVGVASCFLGFLILPALFIFALPAVVDGESIGGALGTVTEIVPKSFAYSLALFYLCALVILAGIAACLLPALLVSWPITLIAATYGYRVLAGKPVNR